MFSPPSGLFPSLSGALSPLGIASSGSSFANSSGSPAASATAAAASGAAPSAAAAPPSAAPPSAAAAPTPAATAAAATAPTPAPIPAAAPGGSGVGVKGNEEEFWFRLNFKLARILLKAAGVCKTPGIPLFIGLFVGVGCPGVMGRIFLGVGPAGL